MLLNTSVLRIVVLTIPKKLTMSLLPRLEYFILTYLILFWQCKRFIRNCTVHKTLKRTAFLGNGIEQYQSFLVFIFIIDSKPLESCSITKSILCYTFVKHWIPNKEYLILNFRYGISTFDIQLRYSIFVFKHLKVKTLSTSV